MTKEQVTTLDLGITPINTQTTLMVESALNWVQENTTLKFDCNNDEDLKALPAAVKLFVLKYLDIMGITGGVTHESIEGLSQSFTGDKNGALWDFAEQLLSKWLKSSVSFIPATPAWRY